MGKTVLIAESNHIFLEVLADMLIVLGFSVVAKTIKQSEIRALTEKYMPDLLIYDFNLADRWVQGFDDLKPLKKKFPKMKIYVLGFHDAADEFEKMIKNHGFDGFLNKLDSRDGLVEKINLIFT